MKHFIFVCIFELMAWGATAQNVRWYQTTQTQNWQVSKAKLSGKALYEEPVAEVKEQGITFEAFGTTFNELDFLALQRLTPEV